jgi:orotidine-5'-phosphate decarboxylase
VPETTAQPLSDGIVPALDVDSVDALRRLVEATTGVDGVVGYKLGMSGALRLGLPGAVAAIREISGLPIVYDHQKAGPDIPDMARKFSALCAEAGVTSLILFPLAGQRAVAEFVGGALDNGLTPIVGGDLPFPEYHVSGGGYVADDALDRILELAIDCGAAEFVLPAHDTAEVRRRSELLRQRVEVPGVYLPGIGALGGSVPEAFAAAEGCRRYAVVGRAIAAADDPGEAAKRLGEQALTAAAKA